MASQSLDLLENFFFPFKKNSYTLSTNSQNLHRKINENTNNLHQIKGEFYVVLKICHVQRFPPFITEPFVREVEKDLNIFTHARRVQEITRNDTILWKGFHRFHFKLVCHYYY